MKYSTYMLYCGDSDLKYDNVSSLINKFLSLKIKFYIMVRNEKLYKLIYDNITDNIVYARTTLEVESIISKFDNLQIIFYLSNSSKNIHSLALNKYTHILIYNNNIISKTFRAYDELWLPSEYTLDKIKKEIPNIAQMPISLIGNIGLNPSKSINNRGLYIISKIDNCIFNVIKYSIEYAKLYMHDLVFVFKKNIVKNIFLKDIKIELQKYANENNVKCCIYNNIQEELLSSSYIVCDIKTYKDEFLINNVPIYIYKPANTYIDEEMNLTLEALYGFSNIDELKELLKNDTKASKRDRLAQYRLGKSYIAENKFKKLLFQEQ